MEEQQLKHELAPFWDASNASGFLAHYATVPAPPSTTLYVCVVCFAHIEFLKVAFINDPRYICHLHPQPFAPTQHIKEQFKNKCPGNTDRINQWNGDQIFVESLVTSSAYHLIMSSLVQNSDEEKKVNK